DGIAFREREFHLGAHLIDLRPPDTFVVAGVGGRFVPVRDVAQRQIEPVAQLARILPVGNSQQVFRPKVFGHRHQLFPIPSMIDATPPPTTPALLPSPKNLSRIPVVVSSSACALKYCRVATTPTMPPATNAS